MMKPSEFAGQTAGSIVEVLCQVPPGGDFHAAKTNPSGAKSVVQSDLLNAEELRRLYATIFNIPRWKMDGLVDAALKLVDLEHARKRLRIPFIAHKLHPT